jgi:hypothetical protein
MDLDTQNIKKAIIRLADLVEVMVESNRLGREVIDIVRTKLSISSALDVHPIDIEVQVNERKFMKAVITPSRGIQCVETPHLFNVVKLRTETNIRTLSIDFAYRGRHVHDVIESIDVERVGDLIYLACNLEPEEIDIIAERIREIHKGIAQTLEQLRHILAMVKMVIGT